jgi:hypothetical protein
MCGHNIQLTYKSFHGIYYKFVLLNSFNSIHKVDHYTTTTTTSPSLRSSYPINILT